jgi:hypothetical protein
VRKRRARGHEETPKEKMKIGAERGGPENIGRRRAVRAVQDLVFISNRA